MAGGACAKVTAVTQLDLLGNSAIVESRPAWSWGGDGSFTATLTAYDACPHCTGKDESHPAFGITKSGTMATAGRTVAVDPDKVPLGSLLYIEGLGVFMAEDTGGAIKGDRIDVFLPTHADALVFGIKKAKVHVYDQEGVPIS